MKIIKRLLLLFLILVILFIAAAVAIPYFYKDEIIAGVKNAMNDNLNAEADFADVDISLFRSFPNLNLSIKDYTVVGKEEFAGIPLISGKSIDIVLDIVALFKNRESVSIHSIHFDEPNLSVQVLPDGKANYDIYKSDTEEKQKQGTETNDDVWVKLSKYSISKGKILYDDKSTGVKISMTGLDHTGKGKFNADIFDLTTKSTAEQLSFTYNGITYLSKCKTNLDAIFNMNLPEMIFQLKDNDLWLNDFHLKGDGNIQLPENGDIVLDFHFSSPQNRFKNFLSVIPGAFTKDFEQVQAHGSLKFDALVNGIYNENHYPPFEINFQVENADVKYPGLPLPINGINSKVFIKSPSSDLDKMTIDNTDTRFQIGDNPFKTGFSIKTPISDPDINGTMKGIIDLAQFAKAYPIEGVKEMQGIIKADLKAKAKMSDIERERYDDVMMQGTFDVKDLKYKSDNYPSIQIKTMKTNFSPKKTEIQNFKGIFGHSDLSGSGTIENIIAWFSPEKTMKGNLTVNSTYFDLNEWMEEETATTSQPQNATPNSNEEIFDRFNFHVTGNFDEIIYDNYHLNNLKFKGNASPQKLTVDNFGTRIGKSDFNGSGAFENLFGYMFDNQVLTGNLNFQSSNLDANELMALQSTPETSGKTGTQDAAEPFRIPENIDISINTTIKKLIYTDYDLRTISGKLEIKEGALNFQNFIAYIFEGKLNMIGSYLTKGVEKPEFNFKYDFENLDFQKTFNTFNSFKRLAPIGQFIEGKFSTKLVTSGQMGDDMFPDLNTISADGFLHTIHGVIKGFAPLQKVGSTLNVDYFNDIVIEDTKNWLTIKDGLVEVKEFDLSHKGIDMKIGGTHGINQEMNYNIKAKITREMLNNNAVGAAAEKGLDFLKSEAEKLGVNLKTGKYVNVLINLTGSIKNPKVKLKLLGTEGEESLKESVEETVKDIAEKEAEKIKNKAEEELEKGKEKAKEAIDEAAEKARQKAKEEAEKLKQKAKEEAEKALKEELKDKVNEEVLDKAEEKLDEILDEKGNEEIDKIKDKLDNWNPFKKKEDEK